MGTKFERNTKVFCDDNHSYISYTQFVKKHPKYAARFAYKCQPIKNETYRILGVYNHVMEDMWDDNDFVIVVESVKNRQIFLIGELGLKEASTKKTKINLNEKV